VSVYMYPFPPPSVMKLYISHMSLEITFCLAALIINCGIHKLLMMNTNFKHYLILKRKYTMPHGEPG
jgi:hypothetical protein